MGIGRLAQAGALVLILATIPRVTLSDDAWLVVYYLDAAWLTPVPTLFNAGILLLVGRAAVRRKRSAAGLIVLLAVPNVIRGALVGYWALAGTSPFGEAHDPRAQVFDIGVGACSLALIIVVVACRRAFTSAPLPGARRPALLALLGGFVAAVSVGWLMTWNDPHSFATRSDRWWWLVHSAIGSTPNQLVLDAMDASPSPVLLAVVTTISAIGIATALALYTRSAREWLRIDSEQELAIRRLLAAHPSEDSLAYFATRRDKAVVFSPDGAAAVSYGVVGGVALASGDPLGDPRAWPAAIREWQRTTHRFGWATAVVAASEDGARAYAQAGMATMLMGDEAVLDTTTFSLAAPALRSVRAAVRRAESAGLTVTVRRAGDIPDDEVTHLSHLVERWRSGEERGFSMALGRFGDPADARYVVVVARDAQGEVEGLLGFAPWGTDGLSLDVMRRAPWAVNGVTELMVTSLALQGRDLRVRRLSLNFAMFRESLERGERIGASKADRLRRAIVLMFSRFWQLDSLYRSNAKYQPRWQPRLLCHEPGLSQASALLATARAEGFMSRSRTHAPHVLTAAPHGLASVSYADFVAAVREIHDRPPVPACGVRRTNQELSRLRNLETLQDAGLDPYPVAVPRDASVPAVRAQFAGLGPSTRTGARVSLVGRLVGRRHHGGVTFLDLREAGAEIQVRVERGAVADARLLTRTADLGDLVSVSGEVVTTARGELTVDAEAWAPAGKSLQAPPARRTGLVDADTRLRLRHVDIATRAQARQMLVDRSAAVRALRDALVAREFVEVETPILQAVHGGANARPFRTHINAYGADLSLRIAPELALKRLAVGGLDRVFEVGRNFRNEGADATHNPEFTAIEAYQAFADYSDMRELARDLILAMACAVHGEPVARRPDGTRVRLDVPWPVVTVHDAVSAAAGAVVTPDSSVAEVRAVCAAHGVHAPRDASAGLLVAELYDALVEPRTQGPTFYVDFPLETSPLTRRHRDDPRLAERWDLVAFGAELGTAYSELTDPVDQRARLTAQSLLAAGGDLDAMELDEDFLHALEFGMPPTGGLGMGVDRILMLLTGTSIRQTLAFPFVRPAPTATRPPEAR